MFVYYYLSVTLESGALCVRSRGALFERSLRRGLWITFDAVFNIFFRRGSSYQRHYIVLISVARWRHNIREISVKNCEKSKNGGKVV